MNAIANDLATALQEGVLLEETGDRIEWWATWRELRATGSPESGEDQQSLCWRDRLCLGGLRCTLWCESPLHQPNLRCLKAALPVDGGASHQEAAHAFDESVALLREALGPPRSVKQPAPPYMTEMTGHAEWRVGDVVVAHSLTTPWDGWSNLTTIEYAPRRWSDRFKQVGAWLFGGESPRDRLRESPMEEKAERDMLRTIMNIKW